MISSNIGGVNTEPYGRHPLYYVGAHATERDVARIYTRVLPESLSAILVWVHILLFKYLCCVVYIFKDYLTDRTQVVKVNRVVSDEENIEYGVPQGSILGPTLFLIHVNDLMNAT